MKNPIVIQPPQRENFEDWCRLYVGYAEFYQVPMNETILNTLWGWIMDEDHEIECLLAFTPGNGRPCGFAHVRRMPNPLRGKNIGFLDDLFVDPASRGKRVGEALFDALRSTARERGWAKIRWITADDNYRARNLYDRISDKTEWNTYEMVI